MFPFYRTIVDVDANQIKRKTGLFLLQFENLEKIVGLAVVKLYIKAPKWHKIIHKWNYAFGQKINTRVRTSFDNMNKT